MRLNVPDLTLSHVLLLAAHLAHQLSLPLLSHACSDPSCVCVYLTLAVCVSACASFVYSWPSPGHQPGEEQAFPGCICRLLGGGKSSGSARWLPGGQRQQPQYARPARSAGEGWAPAAFTHGRTRRMFNFYDQERKLSKTFLPAKGISRAELMNAALRWLEWQKPFALWPQCKLVGISIYAA